MKLRNPSFADARLTMALVGMVGAAVSAAASTSSLSEHSIAKQVVGGALFGIAGGAIVALGTGIILAASTDLDDLDSYY